MKTIKCGDTHLGEAKDSPYIQKAQKLFFKQMCDYAKENGIRVLLQAGDWFDVRSGVTQETLRFMREEIRPMLADAFDVIHVIPGNHDCHYKNTVMPNSVHENFGHDPLFKIYNEPTTILLGSLMFDMIPWECKENKEQIREFIKNSASQYSMGHWELMGFDFYSGIPAIHGEDKEFLSKYKTAFSGHYHTASKKGNVHYLGTPYTITMNDCNDVRGFYVFDTDTEELEFVPNENMWHVKVNYEDVDKKDVSMYTDKCVMLVIHKSDKELDATLTALEAVVEKLNQKNLEDFSGAIDDADEKDLEVKTIDVLIKEYINSMDLDEKERDHAMKYASRLFIEANNS
ncbi:endonuclease subunit [Aeromonas phage AS-sw]|uniref:Endonuclease subunit n=1 Tax=Aeromonas phage AS-sw TaxID=2026113 RepID=A0A291LG24_9CAUD|nr:endonuclease subunit [Aeromonas phage AS-sw]ATI18310.1 endonuclease subunit [Aeromonas phage AS-sw]